MENRDHRGNSVGNMGSYQPEEKPTHETADRSSVIDSSHLNLYSFVENKYSYTISEYVYDRYVKPKVRCCLEEMNRLVSWEKVIGLLVLIQWIIIKILMNQMRKRPSEAGLNMHPDLTPVVNPTRINLDMDMTESVFSRKSSVATHSPDWEKILRKLEVKAEMDVKQEWNIHIMGNLIRLQLTNDQKEEIRKKKDANPSLTGLELTIEFVVPLVAGVKTYQEMVRIEEWYEYLAPVINDGVISLTSITDKSIQISLLNFITDANFGRIIQRNRSIPSQSWLWLLGSPRLCVPMKLKQKLQLITQVSHNQCPTRELWADVIGIGEPECEWKKIMKCFDRSNVDYMDPVFRIFTDLTESNFIIYGLRPWFRMIYDEKIPDNLYSKRKNWGADVFPPRPITLRTKLYEEILGMFATSKWDIGKILEYVNQTKFGINKREEEWTKSDVEIYQNNTMTVEDNILEAIAKKTKQYLFVTTLSKEYAPVGTPANEKAHIEETYDIFQERRVEMISENDQFLATFLGVVRRMIDNFTGFQEWDNEDFIQGLFKYHQGIAKDMRISMAMDFREYVRNLERMYYDNNRS